MIALLTAFIPLLETIAPFFINMFVQDQAKKQASLDNFRKWIENLKSQYGMSESLKDSYDQQVGDLKKDDPAPKA